MKDILAALKSWRTASVTLLSFSSGLPLGIVMIAIPDWMRDVGVDIRIVGLITLAQLPWSLKVLWAPTMDRWQLPWLGRRRDWTAVMQIALLILSLMLAGVGHHPDTPWVVAALAFAIAIASASQDIALDAYAVDVLHREEQGIAVGARTAFYRIATGVSGGLAITCAGWVSWPVVNACLALLYLPLLWITWKAPDPEVHPIPPKTIREAVWEPLHGFLSRPRAMEILAFVIFYKLADTFASALIRPFLIDMGYSSFDRGVALATMGLTASLVGSIVGGVVTTAIGLGNSLWVFGFLQIFSNIGYAFIADSPVNRLLMYSAVGVEHFTGGLGAGAFGVFLFRITQKRFSATQYALFSSFFALPRIISGPITGFVVNAIGWKLFFWLSLTAGIPGMILLQRFAPLGVREPAVEQKD